MAQSILIDDRDIAQRIQRGGRGLADGVRLLLPVRVLVLEDGQRVLMPDGQFTSGGLRVKVEEGKRV